MTYFVGLWPIIEHFGGAALVVIGALAYAFATPAWFMPRTKLPAIGLAICVVAFMVGHVMGVKDGSDRVRAQLRVELNNEVNSGNQDREDADRVVGDGLPGWVCDDGYNRATAKCK